MSLRCRFHFVQTDRALEIQREFPVNDQHIYGATREQTAVQILRLPTPATDAASRFWDLRLTMGLERADTINGAGKK